MTLPPGARLGPYELVSLLGAGGMGEVYKAVDTRLHRTVAVKILTTDAANDVEHFRRIQREARMLAAIQHRHICGVFDIGEHDGRSYLVAEYLEGETLSDEIKRGPIAPRKAIGYAIAIASALAHAHGRGVVHRDLKPANVMVTEEGIKLVDFGLARADASAMAFASRAATESITAPGVIHGTLHYMAPEQFQGHADARSDLFALGVLLYEMVAGERPFDAPTPAGVIADILQADVPPLRSDADVASRIDWVIRNCLRKDPANRWQSATDVLIVLQSLATTPAAPFATLKGNSALTTRLKGSRRAARTLWVLAGGVTGAVIAIPALWRAEKPIDLPAARFVIEQPENTSFRSSWTGIPYVSPDGRSLAFVAISSPGGRRRIWAGPTASSGAKVISGTEDASAVFWSANSDALAFFADGKLKRTTLQGEVDVLITSGDGGGGSWSRDGTILFAAGTFGEGGISRVSRSGGSAIQVTRLDERLGETNHLWPQFLKDGRRFIYTVLGPTAPGVYVGALDSTDRTLLLPFAKGRRYSAARYASDSSLWFVENQTLKTVQIDERRPTLINEPVSLASPVAFANPAQPTFSAGVAVVAYRPGVSLEESELVWSDRSGHMEPLGIRGAFNGIAVARDANTIAVERLTPDGDHDIWLGDLRRAALTKFTDDGSSVLPHWDPAGQEVLYGSGSAGPRALHRKRTSGDSHRILLSTHVSLAPMDWSRDGRFVIYQAIETSTKRDLWALRVEDAKPIPLLTTTANETHGRLSPDNKWLAYVSDESGTSAVYICHFPDARHKRIVSTGAAPQWNDNGTELFYLQGHDVMAVSVGGEPTPTIGRPQRLFEARKLFAYAPTTDGRRFLLNLGTGTTTVPPMTVVVNWHAALK